MRATLIKLLLCAIIAVAMQMHRPTAIAAEGESSAREAGGNARAGLLAELQRGGYVLYFRHTSTDFSQDDSKSRGFEDCGNQRNLTDRGRDEARAIGDAVQALKIPITTVLASPYCRTMETARLMFRQAQAMNEVRGGPLAASDPNRYAALKQLLGTPQPRGSNLVIASHGNPFYAIVGPPYLAEGEAAVLRGLGGDRFEVVGRIRREDWSALMAAANRR
jgi:phosphohistidine phosphatase SixA